MSYRAITRNPASRFPGYWGRISALAGLAALTLTVVACGSSGSTSSTSAPAASASASGAATGLPTGTPGKGKPTIPNGPC